MAGLTSALGGIALPALMDKEFSALTFLAVGIQQFQGLSKQEKITLNNIDEDELVPKGVTYIEEIASTYEVRSYVSLFAALCSSIGYILVAKRFGENILICTAVAAILALIVGLIFRRILRRNSINDIADIKMTVDRISLGKEAGSAVSAIHWLIPVASPTDPIDNAQVRNTRVPTGTSAKAFASSTPIRGRNISDVRSIVPHAIPIPMKG